MTSFSLITNSPVEICLPGHPDKVCDQISDLALDCILAEDLRARVAVETMIKNQRVTVSGEVTTVARQWVPRFRAAIEAMFDDLRLGDLEINLNISQQSPQIRGAVDAGFAGDQAVVYGYAIIGSEKTNMMPANHYKASLAARETTELIVASPELRFDGKVLLVPGSFVNGFIDELFVSVQHTEDIDGEFVRELVADHLAGLDAFSETVVYVNVGNDFVVGGAYADAGVTGRKIVADNYGPGYPVGGGAFSGKDLTKVDRLGAYLAREVAKRIASHELVDAESVKGLPLYVSAAYAYGIKGIVSADVGIIVPSTVDPHGKLGKFVDDGECLLNKVHSRMSPSQASVDMMMAGYGRDWTFQMLASFGSFGATANLPVPWEIV